MSGESQLCIKAGLPSTSSVRCALGRVWPDKRTFVLLVAFFALSVPLAFQGEAARAAFPGQNGKLVFLFAGGVGVRERDGSNARQLTASHDRSPSWSPDGTRIAFASDRDGDYEIFVMNADGSDQRQVTFNVARDRTNAWSADGKQIVYDKEFIEIHVVNADGGGDERKVADGLSAGPPLRARPSTVIRSPSPESRVARHHLPQREGPTGDHGARHGGIHADLSPDGKDLVFTRPSDDPPLLGTSTASTPTVSVWSGLTTTPSRSEVGPLVPDGTKIAFLGCPEGRSSVPTAGSHIMNRDGSGEAQVPGPGCLVP